MSSNPINQHISHPGEFFVGGDWIAPSSGARIDVIQPGTEELYLSVAEAKAADVDSAVLAARRAFDLGPWPRMSPSERTVYLRRIAQAMAKHNDAFATLWSAQTGLVHSLSKAIIPSAAQTFEYYAGLGDSYPFIERHAPRAGGNFGLLVREPVGVVAAIVPWNAPLPLLCFKVAPALIAGCTVIVKASPEAPGEALLFAEAVREAGLPEGVVNIITADREVSELLVRNPAVDKVTFTGSTAAGKKIAGILTDRVARVSLELGGKNAAVILDDYDLTAAAQTLSATALYLSGQACGALTRVIVERSRHHALVEALSGVFSALKVGDQFDPDTQVGPLATARQRQRVEGYIAKGKAEGAVLAAGGGRPRHLERGFFVEPTVFGNVDNSMVIAREEIFGPVICVIPSDSDADSIRIANDSDFGLNATVYTNDFDRAYQVARQIRSGTVGHNAMRGDFAIGWGGFKQSGIGREGSIPGLQPFLESKTIILDGEPPQLSKS
ncbi:aldehyde dehydrogenase [Xenophilus azovorans]|uniref:aldehyde dehydrogenase n=1 Tax=Xenophilus azovorans TaxID=151755 RepID=UPI000571DBBB|nr:aldehyde dehydrogenase [Xenophilus azovorans]